MIFLGSGVSSELQSVEYSEEYYPRRHETRAKSRSFVCARAASSDFVKTWKVPALSVARWRHVAAIFILLIFRL